MYVEVCVGERGGEHIANVKKHEHVFLNVCVCVCVCACVCVCVCV